MDAPRYPLHSPRVAARTREGSRGARLMIDTSATDQALKYALVGRRGSRAGLLANTLIPVRSWDTVGEISTGGVRSGSIPGARCSIVRIVAFLKGTGCMPVIRRNIWRTVAVCLAVCGSAAMSLGYSSLPSSQEGFSTAARLTSPSPHQEMVVRHGRVEHCQRPPIRSQPDRTRAPAMSQSPTTASTTCG
jgi:hypothetical protein